jgi:hypothetical protein
MATVERLPDALRDRTAGSTRVIAARVRDGEDSEGRPALFVTLVLSDPQGDTWPVDDLWELRRDVQSVISKVNPDLETPWFIAFEPEHAEQQEPDDTREQVEAD